MTKQVMFASVLALFGGPATAEAPHPLVETGLEAYEFLCAKCHGKDMVNPGTSSFDLRKWPQENRAGFEQSVLKGKGDMPAWEDVLLEGELEALWAYVVTRGGKEPLPEELASDTLDSGGTDG